MDSIHSRMEDIHDHGGELSRYITENNSKLSVKALHYELID
jgi:hypothetical protein